MVFGFLEKVEYGLVGYFKVLAWFLYKGQGLAVGVEGTVAVKLLVEGVDDGVVEVVHVL